MANDAAGGPIFESIRGVRIGGVWRKPGDQFDFDLDEVRHLIVCGDIRLVDAPPLWRRVEGRDLHAIPLGPSRWNRVVACLNIWNDCNAIRSTIGSWYDHVDAVIAVDGAYPTTGADVCASTDGTLDFLRDQPKVELITAPPTGWWTDQNQKRSAYLRALQAGDLAFVVDADETVTGAAELRRVPDLDVGWVEVSSPLYARAYGQPRLFRAAPDLEYRGRHHWLYRGDALLTTHQYGGTGFVHAPVPIALRNSRGLGHSIERKQAKRTHALAQSVRERELTSGAAGTRSDRTDSARESLRIAQVTIYDAGLAVSRLHSAINATTPHTSLMFREKDEGPYGALTQFERHEEPALTQVVASADVVHCHLRLGAIRDEQLSAANWLVLHHHGSIYRKLPAYHNALSEHYRALVLVSTLELLQYGRALWLPNPMPVARYRQLRAELHRPAATTLRVAHSPSKREYKGTDTFLEVCERLRARGVPIEPVLIEGVAHGEALALKAQCDACFDSFWLGIQCSGLEAAAMGMPVIAGDEHVAAEYRRIVGDVPYTFANDARELEDALAALATDRAFRDREAERVTRYCTDWHDEAAVAIRYLDLLDDAFAWRRAMELGNRPEPIIPERPEPEHPEPEPVETPKKEKPRRPVREPVETR